MADEKSSEYIRTYQGDIDAVQKGQVPNLVPFTKPTPTPERVGAPTASVGVPPPPPPPPPEPEPLPPPPPPPPPPTPEVAEAPVESSEMGPEAPALAEVEAPMESAEPELVPQLAPEKKLPAFEKIRPPEDALETYASDFQNQIKSTNASTVSILAAQEDARTGEPHKVELPKASPTSIAMVVGGVTLLLGAGVGGFFAYQSYTSRPQPVVPTVTAPAPIAVDERVQVDGEGVALARAIAASVESAIASGSIRHVYTPASISTSSPVSVFAALGNAAPSMLVRNINPNGSMAGVVRVKGEQSAFFILSVASFSETFSGMLSWEKVLPGDLGLLYPLPLEEAATPAPAVTATTSVKNKKATTTPIVVLPPPPLSFVDEVVANHDVRVFRDRQGKSRMLYGYWNSSILVIARDSDAFLEVINHLATARPQ